jgi:HPt (histidine-containing phosphotransfer) domain-containing protein
VTVSGKSSVAKKLTALQLMFKQRLSSKIDAIECAWRDIYYDEKTSARLNDMHFMVHSLAGSAGSLGAALVGDVAQELGQMLPPLLNECDQRSPACNALQKK